MNVFDLVKNWSIVDGVDVFKSNSISYSSPLQVELYHLLKPNSFVYRSLLSNVNIFKYLNLKHIIKIFINLFYNLHLNPKNYDILFLYDVDNDYITQSLNLITNKFELNNFSCVSLVITPNIYKKCKNNQKFFNSSKLNLKECLDVLNISFKLNNTLSKYRLAFFKNGLSIKLIRYIQLQIISLVYESHYIKRNLELIKPKVIILGNDCHRTSRLFVQHSKNLNIKSYVVQHGFTTWKYGYLPLQADYIFVWGKFFKDWFVSNNTNPARVLISGNLLHKQILKNQNKNNNNKTVYIFTNPINPKTIEIVLCKITKLAFPPNTNIILKLHPNERLRDYHNKFISSIGSRRATISRLPLHELDISIGDIAININSTAGLDSCVMGAYVLSIDFKSLPKTIDYELYNLGVNTSIYDININFLKLLKLDKNLHQKYIKKFISDFLGIENSLDFIYNKILKYSSFK